jgi:7-cyano-7-deazaguanine synthase
LKTALLLSGGMDSVAIAAWKRPDVALTINYGQKAAKAELVASAQVCKELGIDHEVITVDCSSLGSGDMAHAAPDAAAPTSEWWPYRNQLLITLACMRAISLGVSTLAIGTVCSDGESHLDGTPQFVRLTDALMAYQEGGLRVEAPAIEMSTAELVRHSGISAGLLAWSHSCHKADIACGNCRGCNKYLSTYAELGPEYGFG